MGGGVVGTDNEEERMSEEDEVMQHRINNDMDRDMEHGIELEPVIDTNTEVSARQSR